VDSYSFDLDVHRRVMHIVLRGYWDQATFDAFYEQALHKMKAAGGLEFALVDGREFAVQAKDISEQFGGLVNRFKHLLARRTASVVPAQLNKLQAERAGGDMAARYFTDMDEARAWLFGADAAPALKSAAG
jgi:hypothetical protein